MVDFSLIPAAYAGVITDAPSVSHVLENVVNFLLKILGIVSIIAFAGSGVIYLVSSGNEKVIEKAKRWMFYSVAGLLVSLGSLVVISTIDFLSR